MAFADGIARVLIVIGVEIVIEHDVRIFSQPVVHHRADIKIAVQVFLGGIIGESYVWCKRCKCLFYVCKLVLLMAVITRLQLPVYFFISSVQHQRR